MLSRSLAGSVLTLTIAALLLALLSAAPVNCACNPSHHLGHAVHSLLPHHHAEPAGAALAEDQRQPLGPHATSLVSSSVHELVTVAVESPPLPGAVLGLLLLPLLSLLRPSFAFERPREHLQTPPTDPPR